MLYSRQTILVSSVRIVHAINKGKVTKHRLSAILTAFMLTTPAASAAPEVTNGTEATMDTTGTTTTITGATTTATTTGGMAAGAVGTATAVGVAMVVGVVTLAAVAANDSGDGGPHNTPITTSTIC